MPDLRWGNAAAYGEIRLILGMYQLSWLQRDRECRGEEVRSSTERSGKEKCLTGFMFLVGSMVRICYFADSFEVPRDCGNPVFRSYRRTTGQYSNPFCYLDEVVRRDPP